MTRPKDVNYAYSRRTFFGKMRWAPLLFLPAPLYALPFQSAPLTSSRNQTDPFPFSDFHVTPHYPTKSPVEDLLRLVAPGLDEYVTEKYAFEIMRLLNEWSRELQKAPPALAVLAKFLDTAIEATSFAPHQETTIRAGNGIEVFRKKFSPATASGRERFLQEMKGYLESMSRLETAEFEIVDIQESSGSPPRVHIDIRYDLVGTRADAGREERIGHWLTEWTRDEAKGWRALRWTATEESVSRTREPIFMDVTSQALGQTESYKNQLHHGVDSWRTVLDGACGIDVYGNNGVAVGDFDGDSLDDMYICQPAGLPNRLYRNRGDGTFEDVTKTAGVDVLDSTACALFADFENKGLQDLLVVCGSGPLLFLNQGNGKFERKRDAFKFVKPPQGTFTHAALADYDGDGRLDIYFCLYSYYLGLDQYHYPAPYFDARNGPPNFLFHNEGNGIFQDRTAEAGLNAENDRYSFACAWGDANADGSPDLYVVNDFGRSNLYRNNGDGTFKAVSDVAGVADVGAGMSASWFDFDNDGNQDICAANMWSAAGIRVSEQPCFHEKDPENIRSLYRQHARGNSLYKNLGNGKFQNVSDSAGVAMGRWAWSSDSWDFDHDGYPDLYIANGYISGPETPEHEKGREKDDLSSFFWRQLVAKSPQDPIPSANYELGWNAINELIRSDSSWSGRERNVFYVNNHDGTFSEISGTVGMDFPDDSRSFALADLDHDGRLEVILKNRSGPQLRILHNTMKEKDLGNSIVLRLRGVKSNRDAIGAAVTIETPGHRQTKYLQAGSGFLSQHTKELFFGVGKTEGTVRASIHWPSGLKQAFQHLPVGHRVDIQEGSEDFQAKPFAVSPASYSQVAEIQKPEPLPTEVETWLIEPIRAPEFSLPDLASNLRDLQSFRGGAMLLTFWTMASPLCREQLQLLERYRSKFASSDLRIVGVNVDDNVGDAGNNPSDVFAARSFAAKAGLTFPNLLATQDMTGIYNIIYRYLFDRRRDLALPTSFLLDQEGMIVKVYQGSVKPERLIEDVKSLPSTPKERAHKALPLGGTLHLDVFQRNAFTYGIAFFQHGYLEQAEASFKQVIAAKPDNPEAYYNLGTLYLRKNALPEARQYLEQTVKLRPKYPEAWNNLGMIAAQEGRTDEAIPNFQQSLSQRPDYVTALLNLGNLYRRQGVLDEAEKLLRRAVELEPGNPEANYSLAMFYVRQDQLDRGLQYLEKAVNLRPGYPDALNNLGVLFVRQKNYSAAEEQFKTCIRVAPNFDQAYLNLARLYVILDDKDKSREILQTLLRLQPQHKVALQTLEMLN
jgi:tetratricopeptide (TPR) repeat protein/peroxiredoxin